MARMAIGTPTGQINYLPVVSTFAVSLIESFEFPRFKATKNKASANTSFYILLPHLYHFYLVKELHSIDQERCKGTKINRIIYYFTKKNVPPLQGRGIISNRSD